jgi:hypothetical protein
MTVTRVQQTDNGGAGLNATTATFGSTPTSGNLLIARCYVSTTGRNITITAGTWTIIETGTNGRAKMFYRYAGASEPTAVEMVIDGAAATIALQLDEYSGLAPSGGPVDSAMTAFTTTTSQSSGTLTTTSQSEGLAIVQFSLGGAPGTTTPGFTNSWENDRSPGTADNFRQAARKILSAPEAVETTMSWTTTRAGEVIIAAFEAPAAVTGSALEIHGPVEIHGPLEVPV